MTRADGITGEGGREREPGKTRRTWSLFLHHVVFLLPLPLLQCCLPKLTMTSFTIFRQLLEQRDLNLTCCCKRNKIYHWLQTQINPEDAYGWRLDSMELFSPLQANSCSTMWLKHCSICLLRWMEISACEALSRQDKGTISM